MDPEVEELKKLVQQDLALNADTNRTVHKMRRGVWWGRVFQILFWLLVLGASGAAYYYYLEPYVAKAGQYYQNFQHSAQQAQGWEAQASEFFKNLFSPQTGSTVQAK